MAGIFLTQNNTFIIGDVAKILGWIMDVLFDFLNFFGIHNIGLSIILFTLIIYLLMTPLTYKQQKFSKMSSKMNPEIQAIQRKYRNKKDNESMMAQNEEIQAVYAKYGVSASGSCLQLIIQMPILFALYRVIMNVPAYVSGVKDVFVGLADRILATPGGSVFMEEMSKNARLIIEGKDYTQVNTIIDVLYQLQDSGNATWQMLIDKFPQMESMILETQASANHMNYFLGINIANSPMNIIKMAFVTGSFVMIIGAVLIPVLAALTQWMNVKMMPQQSTGEGNETMNATMKSMNTMMPLMSAFFCVSLPVGMGLYWIMGAVIRGVQQFVINKYLDKLDLDEIVRKNIEKNNRIREKKGLPPQKIGNIAKTNVKSIESDKKKKGMTEEERKAAIEASTNYYKNADKPGSLASKAAMVSKFNEKSKK